VSTFLGKWIEAQARVADAIKRAQSAPPEVKKKIAELHWKAVSALVEYGDQQNRANGEPLQRETLELAAIIAVRVFESLMAGGVMAKLFDKEEWRGVMEAMEQNLQPRMVDKIYDRLNKLDRNPYAKKRP
jgi:Mn-dependent DtxR family transcriptional regulator